MKKSISAILIISLFAMACGSSRKMAPVQRTAPVSARPVPPPVQEPIPVIEESFEFDRQEDKSVHDDNRFFVILGSFMVKDNAGRFQTKLRGEGFDPVILLSETGLNRVCIGSYSREADARQRVMEIRRSRPEYHDSWLLIRR